MPGAADNENHAGLTGSIVVVLGVLMGASAFGIDVSLPALPAVADALSVSDRDAQLAVTWALAGYALAQIPIGLASDRYGRKRLALMCLAMFAVGGAGAASAPSIEVLWLFRLLQGFGVAGCPLLARAIVRDASSGDSAGRSLSSMSAILGVISATAPILGGFLLSLGGWRLPFAAIAVYGVLAWIALERLLPESRSSTAPSSSAVTQLRQSIAAFLREPSSIYAVLMFALVFAGFAALLTTGSTVTTRVFGFRPETFGFFFAAVVGPQVLGSLLSRWMSLRHGMAAVLAAGAAAVGIASLCLFIVGWLSNLGVLAVWLPVMLYGFGFGILMPSAVAVALEPLPNLAGFASALMGTLQVGAGSLSSALAAAFYSDSPRSMCWVMAISGVGVVACWWVGRTRWSPAAGQQRDRVVPRP